MSASWVQNLLKTRGRPKVGKPKPNRSRSWQWLSYRNRNRRLPKSETEVRSYFYSLFKENKKKFLKEIKIKSIFSVFLFFSFFIFYLTATSFLSFYFYWKKVELHNSTFWNVGEKSGFLFSICGTWESGAISRLGWCIFLVACYATLYPAMSVRRSVGPSVRRSPFYFFYVFALFGFTAPAQMLQ